MQIEWSDALATGNSLVDHQHQGLISAINAFDEAMASGSGGERVDEMLAFLDRYVREHFSTEEFLMLRANFPELELHKAEHERLLLRVKFILELRTQDPSLVPVEGLAKFLGNWLQDHILVWDQALFTHIHAHPLVD
jgi:hemerythrin